jgi:hypothetical protein
MDKLSKSYGGRHGRKQLGYSPLDFVAIVDGITFGAIHGKSYDTGNSNWSKEDKIKWAKLSALFFHSLAEKLEAFQAIVEKEKSDVAS